MTLSRFVRDIQLSSRATAGVSRQRTIESEPGSVLVVMEVKDSYKEAVSSDAECMEVLPSLTLEYAFCTNEQS